jgi:hypothetical protein
MWRGIVARIDSNCTIGAPASRSSLAEARRTLGCDLPKELAALWRETNGVIDDYGNDVVAPVEVAIAWNVDFRTRRTFHRLYMPFDHLLFFGGLGNGSLSAYRILGGKVRDRDIYCWNHENDSRIWAARDLERYLTAYFAGELEV